MNIDLNQSLFFLFEVLKLILVKKSFKINYFKEKKGNDRIESPKNLGKKMKKIKSMVLLIISFGNMY